jgi:hypothetical protein
MKYLRYFFAAFLVAFLAIGTSHALLGEASDTFTSTGIESDLTINFPGETRWVEVMEGGSGGGGMVGFLRIHVIDAGLSELPYVQVYNNTQLWMEFQMTPEEVAHIFVYQEQGSPLLKQVDIRDNNPIDFFSKAEYTFFQPGCSQTVQTVRLVPNSNPVVSKIYAFVGAIFTKYDLCTQKVLLI